MIKTQEDLNAAMLESLSGIYDESDVPELTHIEELITACQEEEELKNLRLDDPAILKKIKETQRRNIDPEQDGDIRSFITTYHVLSGVPAYKKVLGDLLREYNLYILDSHTGDFGYKKRSDVSIAYIYGTLKSAWIVGHEMDLMKGVPAPDDIAKDFESAVEHIRSHCIKLPENDRPIWLGDVVPPQQDQVQEVEEALLKVLSL